jgi:spermidine/putrescine ABC transporter ATP-binding subunit
VDSGLTQGTPLPLAGEAAAPCAAGEGAHGASVVLSEVEKHFDSLAAVRGVSLDIRSGEFLTLLGPSGSGKTTTLMMIAGFETPNAGDIAIDGRSVLTLPPYRRNIGMVFQNYALFPHLTVADNVGFPLKQRRVDRATRARLVAESLALVHLPGYERRYPRQLSGGQQQRVALARAIVFRPRLLLMDEPLGALDKQLRENLQLEMRRLHADLGITFIYVTHDQQEALTMSDRVAVMNDGVVAQVGTPEDLYDRPCSRFVASFIGESNFLPAVVRGNEHEMTILDCAGATMRALTRHAQPVGGAVTLAIRPERLRFGGATGDTAENRIPVTIRETVFAGDCCRYLCQASGAITLALKQPSGSTIQRRHAGESADVVWSAADCIIV